MLEPRFAPQESFEVQPALYADNFQGYSATGQLIDGCTSNGTRIITAQTIPFLPGQTMGGPGQFFAFAMGANINSGPDAAQSRWWRELGIYLTRPSVLPIGE